MNNRNCRVCDKSFKATNQQIKKGAGKYCSRKCHGKEMAQARKNDGNPAWKGDKVGYSGIHIWLRNNFGYLEKCERCGSTKFVEWALRNGKKYERKRENFISLCRSCHMKMDYANGTRIAYNEAQPG